VGRHRLSHLVNGGRWVKQFQSEGGAFATAFRAGGAMEKEGGGRGLSHRLGKRLSAWVGETTRHYMELENNTGGRERIKAWVRVESG